MVILSHLRHFSTVFPLQHIIVLCCFCYNYYPYLSYSGRTLFGNLPFHLARCLGRLFIGTSNCISWCSRVALLSVWINHGLFNHLCTEGNLCSLHLVTHTLLSMGVLSKANFLGEEMWFNIFLSGFPGTSPPPVDLYAPTLVNTGHHTCLKITKLIKNKIIYLLLRYSRWRKLKLVMTSDRGKKKSTFEAWMTESLEEQFSIFKVLLGHLKFSCSLQLGKLGIFLHNIWSF